jgi:branched-chain amino acid transport system ATP-binding protein
VSTTGDGVATADGSVLEVTDLVARYGEVPALSGVSLKVRPGEAVAVVGPNGAGKTTLLRSISGLVRQRTGSIRIGDREAIRMRPHQVARAGFAHVPEGRGTIASMTVEENLLVAAKRSWSGRETAQRVDRMFEVFPLLQSLRPRQAGLLSGGEQQILAIARGLMSDPVILAIDEPSMGLAPVMINNVLHMLRAAVGTGVAILLIEQNAALAAQLADRIYVLVRGQVREEGEASSLAQTDLLSTYLGQEA